MDEIVAVTYWHDTILVFTKYGKILQMKINDLTGDYVFQKLGEVPSQLLKL